MDNIVWFVGLFFDLFMYIVGAADNLLTIFFIFVFLAGCVFELAYSLIRMEY